MANDRLRMRNRLCFDVWNEMSQLPYDTKYDRRNGTKGRFVEVFVNKEYRGIYCMSDKIDRKLLGLKKLQKNGSENTVRGVLYKGVKWGAAYTLAEYDEERVDTTLWNSWELKLPEDYPSLEAWKPLIDLIDFNSGDTRDFVGNYHSHYYIDNLIDYMIFCYAFNMLDMPYKNTYLSVVDINKDKKFVLTPWDLDGSLGQDWNGYYIDEDRFYFNVFPDDSQKFGYINKFIKLQPYTILFYNNIEGFQELMIKKFRNLYNTLLSPDSIEKRIRQIAESYKLSGAWEREFRKWGKGPFQLLNQNMESDILYAIDWYKLNMSRNVEWMNQTTKVVSHPSLELSEGIEYTLMGVKNSNTKRHGFFIKVNDGKITKVFR